MHTTAHPPSPAPRAGTNLPTNVQAVSRAVSYVNTHRPRFQVRARPSYLEQQLAGARQQRQQEVHGPPVAVAKYRGEAQDLGQQDPRAAGELEIGAQRAAELWRRDLAQVHGDLNKGNMYAVCMHAGRCKGMHVYM